MIIAKNYLSEAHVNELNRIVSAYRDRPRRSALPTHLLAHGRPALSGAQHVR